VKSFYISLLRVTYGWSSFLMPKGSKELWQAAVYLAGSFVLGIVFLISFPLDQYIEDDARGHVCAVLGVLFLVFNYWFAMKNGEAIRRESSGASMVAAHLVVISLITAGAVAIFLPAGIS
jgi:predicted ABC-type exoprotein transport system permease subunit